MVFTQISHLKYAHMHAIKYKQEIAFLIISLYQPVLSLKMQAAFSSLSE